LKLDPLGPQTGHQDCSGQMLLPISFRLIRTLMHMLRNTKNMVGVYRHFKNFIFHVASKLGNEEKIESQLGFCLSDVSDELCLATLLQFHC
jgi:hypothetical protein